MKTLFFEGAGCVPCGEVANCRIRTAFTNDEGKQIYLEMSGVEVTKNSVSSIKNYKNAGFVDHCHYITGDQDDENKCLIQHQRVFEYTNANILGIVNALGCSFDQIIVLPDLAGYRVFREGKGQKYNFGDEFQFDLELTKKRESIYKHYYELEKTEGKKYPNFSLWVDQDDMNKLHLLRHFNGYNKHWLINIESEGWIAEEAPLGRYAC